MAGMNAGFAAMLAARAKNSKKKGPPPEGSPEEEAMDVKEGIPIAAVKRKLQGGK